MPALSLIKKSVSADVMDANFKILLDTIRKATFKGDAYARECYERKPNIINNYIRSRWISLNKQDLEEVIYSVYYSFKFAIGFPHLYHPSSADLKNFMQFDCRKIQSHQILTPNYLGTNYLASFFPEMAEVKLPGFKYSPLELFHSDKLFDIVCKMFQISDDININSMRDSIKLFGDAQMVTNYKPILVEFLFRKYESKNVLVTSEGYGAKLLAAMKCQLRSYTSVEASPVTSENNEKLQNHISSQMGMMVSKVNITHINQDFKYFTSDYSYDTIFVTDTGYLKEHLIIGANHLETNGVLILHLSSSHLEDNVIMSYANQAGLKLKEILYSGTIARMGTHKNLKRINHKYSSYLDESVLTKYKIEPIFIFSLK